MPVLPIFLRRFLNLTTIEWLDNNWTKALVTEHRLFGDDLFTEAELRVDRIGDSEYEKWFHRGSDIKLPGTPGLIGYSSVWNASQLQKRLSDARRKHINRLRNKEHARIRKIAEAEERALWNQRPRLPAARLVSNKDENK